MLFSTSCTLQFAHHFEKYKSNFPLALHDLLAKDLCKSILFIPCIEYLLFFVFNKHENLVSFLLLWEELGISIFRFATRSLSLSLCFQARNTKSLFGKQSKVFIELFLFNFFMCVCACVNFQFSNKLLQTFAHSLNPPFLTFDNGNYTLCSIRGESITPFFFNKLRTSECNTKIIE